MLAPSTPNMYSLSVLARRSTIWSTTLCCLGICPHLTCYAFSTTRGRLRFTRRRNLRRTLQEQRPSSTKNVCMEPSWATWAGAGSDLNGCEGCHIHGLTLSSTPVELNVG